jgi:peptidyl-tRNA hydrolase, PTH1 family
LDKYLIVGLGNPGFKYRKNRHNAGFIVIDEIADYYGVKFSKSKYNAKTGKHMNEKGEHVFIKPQLYMNNSGISVNTFLYKEKIPKENLIVIYDDIDLPFGTVRYRDKGSAGTHNGMRSVIGQIGTGEFKRVRIGVGKPDNGTELIRYVLGNFDRDQLKILKEELSEQIREKIFGGFLYGMGTGR